MNYPNIYFFLASLGLMMIGSHTYIKSNEQIIFDIDGVNSIMNTPCIDNEQDTTLNEQECDELYEDEDGNYVEQNDREQNSVTSSAEEYVDKPLQEDTDQISNDPEELLESEPTKIEEIENPPDLNSKYEQEKTVEYATDAELVETAVPPVDLQPVPTTNSTHTQSDKNTAYDLMDYIEYVVTTIKDTIKVLFF